ncbi:MAG: hypothetical protein HRF50_00235 [Phycisphaerae bacterium]|jgi:hypothetical protein
MFSGARRALPGLLAASGLAVTLTGCDGAALANFFEERSGNVSVVIINNTPYRALLTLGAYDEMDRNPPGAVQTQQQRIEANTAISPLTVPCRRNTAINTARLIRRLVDTSATATLDADLLDTVIRFSAAPSGSQAADLPTAGTAAPIEVLLGSDYTCGDQLIFTLSEDPNSAGGFRVDYSVIMDEEDDA